MASDRIISSDDHIYEPIDLWTGRMDRKYLDRCPRIVRTESGGDWWVCDEVIMNAVSSGSQAGRRFEEPERLSNADTYDKVRVGGYIPEEHIKDMDLDGIDVSIIYPTAGVALFRVPDSDLLNPVFSTYNDWLAEFCTTNPRRLKAIAMINADDVVAAVSELGRCAKGGFLGAMISVHPTEEHRYDQPEYEPLWVAADLGMPLSLHIGTGRPGPGSTVLDAPKPAGICNVDHWVRLSLSDIIFSGLFERHPSLMVGSVEHELSWVPHFLDRLDYTYTLENQAPRLAPVRQGHAAQRLLPPQRIPGIPGGRPRHPDEGRDRGGRHPVGLRPSPPGVHVPPEPGDPRGHPVGVHRGGEGQDRRRERRAGLPPGLATEAPLLSLLAEKVEVDHLGRWWNEPDGRQDCCEVPVGLR